MQIREYTILTHTNRHGIGGSVRVYKHHRHILSVHWHNIQRMLQVKDAIARILKTHIKPR
jgi:hypothetical protein